MKAVVSERYGGPEVMELREIPKPAPADNEVLVKVVATSLNALDWHFMMADPFFVRFMFGLLKPNNTVMGADVAGVVEAVGKDVTRFKPGDAVFADVAPTGLGGLAEYVTTTEKLLARKPDELSFQEAAALPIAGVTALQGLRDQGNIRPGMNVLINGASGGVGTYGVQLAKVFGADVTAVCSTAKVEQARQLGADHVIDYTKEDFARNGRQYDLILAANGNRTLGDYERALSPTGTFVMAGGSYRQMFETILFGRFKSKEGGKQFKSFTAHSDAADLAHLAELSAARRIRPVIDRCYPLEEAAEAMRYLVAGHARGKIVVIVAPETAASR